MLVLAIYIALLPWTGQVWLRTGDEPHYLVAADSLARDGDFDLRNNYDPAVYQDWYPTATLDRQVKTRADGAQFLIHPYGLSILIAPAYWLAGARGVAYFMALLGAFLAGQVYLLSLQVTGNWRASALGALAVALAPPVVWYVFLLYPEVPGALCVTVAARVLVDLTPPAPLPIREGGSQMTPGLEAPTHADPKGLPRPLESSSRLAWERIARAIKSLGPQLILGLSLAALPWLSARFIPAALILAGLGLWQAARRGGLLAAWPSVSLLALSLAGMAAFNAALYGAADPAASYAGGVGPGPVSWPLLLQIVRGLLGWLVDHQRGLLVVGPIYIVALMGLGRWLWQRAWPATVVGLPLVAALGSTAFVAGFSVGIEPAGRYLVHVLPPLGAALAYAWAHRRGPWLAALTAVTLALSVWAAGMVFREPLLQQTHDLIGEKAARLVPYLPALGHPTYLDPGKGSLAQPVADPPAQATLWRVPKGQDGAAFQQPSIADFTFGWYNLQFDLGARGASPDAPVARVLFQAGDHAPLVDTILYGRDFPADGQPRTFIFPIYNKVYNQWEQPPGFWIFTTGQAELTLSEVALPPDNFHALVMPGLWLAGLALCGALVGARFNGEAAAPALPRWLNGWWPSFAAAGLVFVAGTWSLRPVPRHFAVGDLANFIGSRATDAGQVLTTAGDEGTSGVLAATGFEFLPAGHYRWRLSLKSGAALTSGAGIGGAPLATVTILAPRKAVAGFPADVRAEALPADGRFHTVEFEFDNPIHQALAFELDATGAGPLESQGFEVSPAP